jgi:dihydroxy-acid dehydratase
MAWDPRSRSRTLYDGPDRAPARAMMRAIGFGREALARPCVLVASTWVETMPCNFHLRRLAEVVKEGIREAGATPMEANTIAVSDGVMMGTEGMKASLVSREVIADSIELVARGHAFDAVVALVGCDKTIPGAAMALLRLGVPGLVLYGGSIAAGSVDGQPITIQHVFEAVGARAAGRIDDARLDEIEARACPGAGACGGQYTANTMALALEFLGLSPVGYNGIPALDPAKEPATRAAGAAVVGLLEAGRLPSRTVKRKAFENAIAAVAGTGGSTNAVLHLPAIAFEAKVELELDDFNRIGARVAHVADMKPHGKFHMADLDAVGGVPVVMKMLLDGGLLHGDCLTVTGKTMAENLSMALVGEAAELMEIFQWLSQTESRNVMKNPAKAEAVAHELADVLYYLLRLSDVLGVDLQKAFWQKMRHNQEKYPVKLARGNAKKYNELLEFKGLNPR